MNLETSQYSLFIDESGVSNLNDPSQHWFVLGGICIPTQKIEEANKYIHDVCLRYINKEFLEKSNFELKGRSIVNPKEKRQPFGLNFSNRIRLARELLCINLFIPETHYFVTAIDTKFLPLQKDISHFSWAQTISKEKSIACDLFALTELIGDFAFFLDKDMSNGLEIPTSNMNHERRIYTGTLIVDEATRWKKRIVEIEENLRAQRIQNIDLSTVQIRVPFQLLEDNVLSPIRCDEISHKNYCIQVADILAALFRYKQEMERLPDSLEQLYSETRISFQSHLRFFPSENILGLKFYGHSSHRYYLMQKAGLFID